jgi:CheY-like chemotaxis protein
MLAAKRYDAVVLDIMMGDGNGHEVLDFLATHRPSQKYVVIISATSLANLDKVKEDNVQAKLRKPFEIKDLVKAVQRCVEA